MTEAVIVAYGRSPIGRARKGSLVDVRPDEDLAWIDRMSLKYLGQPYERRGPRAVFTIEVDRVGHSGTWGG